MAVAPNRRRVNPRLEEDRAGFQRYKQDVKERGKPFYPYALFHDTVMSFVVVGVIVALACVWKWTSWNGETGLENGLLGPEYTEKADPGTVVFVPRPDWYFFFLFYLLRIFKWPESVFLGTVGIPTILLVIAFVYPFLDRRAERRPSRRPVAMVALVLTAISMGVLTWKGATAKESLGVEIVQEVPSWAKQQGFQNNKEALAGARLFATSGCTSCHTYLGAGSTNFGAPDLSDIGRSGQNADYFTRYVGDPAQFGNNVMPAFKSLGETRLGQIAAFLVASKGPK